MRVAIVVEVFTATRDAPPAGQDVDNYANSDGGEHAITPDQLWAVACCAIVLSLLSQLLVIKEAQAFHARSARNGEDNLTSDVRLLVDEMDIHADVDHRNEKPTCGCFNVLACCVGVQTTDDHICFSEFCRSQLPL